MSSTQEYFIDFSFKIATNQYHGEVVVFSGSEKVPAGEDPVNYLRGRLGAEIKRTTKDIEFKSADKV